MIPASTLKPIVRALATTVSKRAQLPALSGVRVTLDGDDYRFDVTDLECSLSIGSANGEAPSVLLPFATLKDLVTKASKDDEITIEPAGENKARIIVRPPKGKYAIPVGVQAMIQMPPLEDFPSLPTLPTDPIRWSFDAATFLESFSSVATCTGTDHARPVYTCVCAELVRTGAYLVATDSYRLAWDTLAAGAVGLPPDTDKIAINIPARVAKILKSLITKSTPMLTVVLDSPEPTSVTFIVGNARLTSRLIESDFPNWRQLIPSTYTESIVFVDTAAAFTDTIARVSSILDKPGKRSHGQPIKLECSVAGGVTVKAERQDVGGLAETVPGAVFTAEGSELNEIIYGFTPAYLRSVIAHTGGPIRLQGEVKPALLGNPRRGALIMPVRIS